VKYYKQALQVADEIGMDPFSDEIIGVKIQLAALMEKVQQYKKAIDILEIVKSDNLRWIEELGSKLGNEGKRTRVLGKTVGVSVKLGELYANQYVAEKIRPLLPLFPDNLKKQIWLDQEWWTKNGADMGERWNKWMLSKA